MALYVGEGSRGKDAACSALPGFQSLPLLPISKLGPSGADYREAGFICSRTLWVSLTNSLRGWEFLPLLQLPQVLSKRSLEALFSHAGTLGCVVYLSPQLFLLVYPHTNVHSPGAPAMPCHESSLPRLRISAPSTCLDECFFFNSLDVRLPYRLIF